MAATTVMIAGTTELLDRWFRGLLGFTETEFDNVVIALGRTLAGSL